MKNLTASNDFHNTETTLPALETYENDYGLVAVVDEDDLNRASRELCGMSDCLCSGPHGAVDDEGNVYGLTTRG